MSDSLIPSFLVSNVSELLRSLTKNVRPWAIRSGRSEEISDLERIAQVAHQKWANERIARFFEGIAHLLIFGQKMSDSLGKPMSEFPALAWRNSSIKITGQSQLKGTVQSKHPDKNSLKQQCNQTPGQSQLKRNSSIKLPGQSQLKGTVHS